MGLCYACKFSCRNVLVHLAPYNSVHDLALLSNIMEPSSGRRAGRTVSWNVDGNDTGSVLLSLLGIVIVKCTTNDNRQFVGDLFLGLAVSTMLGDSLLHILPSVLGKLGFNGRSEPFRYSIR